MSSDEGDGDNWPGVRERVLASDMIISASPTWLGKISSVAQRALELMAAMLSEQNEQGQMIAYNRVAVFVVTGNEDGAKNCISELASAAVELGFCVPPLAWTYWNMGPGPGPDYADTDHGKAWSKTIAATCAHNLFHVARALKVRPIPLGRRARCIDDMNDKPEERSKGIHEQGAAHVISLADPAPGEDTGEFQGHCYEAGISFIVVNAPPGGGPKLHMHPYEEVFVVQDGNATFTAGGETIEVSGGQVVVVPAGVPHKFVNSGTGWLRQLDIHASDRFVTEWLEE